MLIYANPSTVPARCRTKKKGTSMAKRKTRKRRAVSRRVTKNPGHFKARRRRATHRNPVSSRRRSVHRNPTRGGGLFKGILGELASTNGILLIGAAVVAPTVTNKVVSFLPDNLKTGYSGLFAKAVVVAAGAWAIDKFAKNRYAAIGFVAGGLGTVVNDAINVIQVRSTLPASVQPAAADEIAANPSAFRALMDGQFQSLNGYDASPMSGYDAVSMGDQFESLN